jgi:hypothetical protein
MKKILIVLTSCLFVVACSPSEPLTQESEAVLKEGTVLTIEGEKNNLQITARKGTRRHYLWNECKLSSRLDLRPERQMGKLGIYDSKAAYLPFFNKCEGITAPLVDEAQIHFSSRQDIEEWIKFFNSPSPFRTLWTDTGLVVRFLLTPNRNRLAIEVLQLCLNGEKPTGLTPSQQEYLTISNESGDALFDCAQVDSDVISKTKRAWITFWRENTQEQNTQEQNTQEQNTPEG